MTTRLTMAAVAGLCGLLLTAGCYNPPVEKLHARRAMQAGDYTTATIKLQGVVDHDPSDWEAHYLLGKAYLGQGKPIQAQSELEQAFAVKDRSASQTPKILDALAESLHMQQKYDELYGFLDAQIDRYQGWEDYARKARFLAKANDIDGAALAYRQAAYFSRNDTEDIYIEIADFYHQRGDYDKELQALKWAYYINDENEALPNRFRQIGYVPGPTMKEQPPQPEYAGARIFDLPELIGD
ncbi:MAG: tetratricopeptide repeat protein [Phycisphaeraceae bacterium]